MRLEILHERDPDYPCDVTVWLDGERVDFDYVEIDPGRGYTADDWESYREAEVAVPARSPAFRAAVDEAFDRGSESKYVE